LLAVEDHPQVQAERPDRGEAMETKHILIAGGALMGAALLFTKNNAQAETILASRVTGDWADSATTAAQRFNVPVARILAIVAQESAGKENAVGDSGLAIGLMQLHDIAVSQVNQSFATRFDYPGDLYDGHLNIQAGAAYLRYCFNQMGDWDNATRAYNAGPYAAKQNASLSLGYLSMVKRHEQYIINSLSSF
jgi:soluble lytic murein transglycosylase-like protein